MDEARRLIAYFLDELRPRRAMGLPEGAGTPAWSDISTWPQRAYGIGSPGRRQNVSQWGAPYSAGRETFPSPAARGQRACPTTRSDRRRQSSWRMYGTPCGIMPTTPSFRAQR